jgi:hypothetical protein
MRRYLLVAILLIGASTTTGCAAVLGTLAKITGSTYLHDRFKDCMDVDGFKLVAGPGSKVGIGFGPAKTGLNFGYYRFEKFGWQGRAAGAFEETGLEILAPVDHQLTAIWGNREIFDMVEEFRRIDGVESRAALFDQELTYPRPRYHTPGGFHVSDMGLEYPPAVLIPTGLLGAGDIQVTLVPLFLGIEFNFSLYQLADYLAGWFYIDIAKDDTRNYTPVGPREDQ